MNKLENFPTAYYMSLEECVDRQKNMNDQFSKYNISLTPIISKRFSESNDSVSGKYLHQLNAGTAGCCVSHLKAIKHWYENYNENFAFFCEDDLSLETIEYWDFTWEEFVKTLPMDYDCIQLLTIRQDFDTFSIRDRYWNDWGATAYIITREYAKKLIDTYIKGDTFHLEIPNCEIMPLIENILFTTGKTYTVPLFVENIEFDSTFSKDQDDDVNFGQKNNHKIAHNIVLNYWKSKMEIKKIHLKSELEQLLTNYSLDTENPMHNFNIAVWYENQGHTAPALSYFLRCAERSDDDNLAYEALIRASYCYDKQGTRDGSAKSLLEQALCVLPKRPEAYFLLSRFAERRQWWQDCYIHANNALMYADFESNPPLLTDVEYPGRYGLLFEKAISGWWWGKNEESKSILLDLYDNYDLSAQYQQSVYENLNRIGVEVEKKLPPEFSNPIPVIGVPIVNGFNWLQRLVDSVDYPVKELCVINNNGRGELDEDLERLSKTPHNFIQKIHICNLPSNIGCSGAYNLIIKSYMQSPYWIICSHDIAFTPNLLKEFVEKSKDENVDIIKGKQYQWDLFLIKDSVIQECGLFDENFYPAYMEDCDYYLRTVKKNIKIHSLSVEYLHGEKDYENSGSQTWRTDPQLREKIDYAHDCNGYYMREKWGDYWRNQEGTDWNFHPFEYPFNNETLSASHTTYDLKFVRRKNLGF